MRIHRLHLGPPGPWICFLRSLGSNMVSLWISGPLAALQPSTPLTPPGSSLPLALPLTLLPQALSQSAKPPAPPRSCKLGALPWASRPSMSPLYIVLSAPHGSPSLSAHSLSVGYQVLPRPSISAPPWPLPPSAPPWNHSLWSLPGSCPSQFHTHLQNPLLLNYYVTAQGRTFREGWSTVTNKSCYVVFYSEILLRFHLFLLPRSYLRFPWLLMFLFVTIVT